MEATRERKEKPTERARSLGEGKDGCGASRPQGSEKRGRSLRLPIKGASAFIAHHFGKCVQLPADTRKGDL